MIGLGSDKNQKERAVNVVESGSKDCVGGHSNKDSDRQDPALWDADIGLFANFLQICMCKNIDILQSNQ